MTPRTKGREPKAVAEDSAKAPKATCGRKAKAVFQDETARSTPAKGREFKAAVAEKTKDRDADRAHEPSVVTGAPDQAK